MSYLDIIRHRKLNTWSIPSCWFSCQTCSTHVNSISVAGIILTSHIKNFKSKINKNNFYNLQASLDASRFLNSCPLPSPVNHKAYQFRAQYSQNLPTSVSTATILLQAISTSHPLPILPASNLSPPFSTKELQWSFSKKKVDIPTPLLKTLRWSPLNLTTCQGTKIIELGVLTLALLTNYKFWQNEVTSPS